MWWNLSITLHFLFTVISWLTEPLVYLTGEWAQGNDSKRYAKSNASHEQK